MLKKILSYSPHIFALLFITAFAAFAWTEPTVAPPGGNVSAPLNIGSIGQSKVGGLILNTGGAANGLIIDQGNVGIGTVSPAGKLDVRGNIYTTGQGATACALWQDCDGDGFTPGYKDCNEGCSTCYQGSVNFTCAADGFDQNCNSVIDEMDPAPAGNQCEVISCNNVSYEPPWGAGYLNVQTSAVESACQSYCNGLGRNYGGYSCFIAQPDHDDYAWQTFDFSTCFASNNQTDREYCSNLTATPARCFCTGYR